MVASCCPIGLALYCQQYSPSHPGSAGDDCAANGERYRRALLERAGDITAVLDRLSVLATTPSWRLHGVVDGGQAGVIGHSQGAQAALMMPRATSA